MMIGDGEVEGWMGGRMEVLRNGRMEEWKGGDCCGIRL